MKDFKDVNEVLDFAIKREQDAANFYSELAERVDKKLKDEFKFLALEELAHKRKLMAVKEGKKLLDSNNMVQDLKISDYLVEMKPRADMNYQEVLMLLMQREKAAANLYSFLAKRAADKELKEMFLGLASEELKHKLRFEIEYDREIFKEN